MQSPVFQKYASAIFSFITVLVSALVASQGHKVDPVLLGQIFAVAAGAVVMYLVPLLPTGWQAGWKVGVQTLAAIATLALPFIFQHGISYQQLLVFIIAVVQVLATQLGVTIRKSDSLSA